MPVYNTDTSAIAPFTGYTPEANEFLTEIKYNNNTQWFNENKQRFIDGLYEPTRSLIWALRDFFAQVDPQIDIEPKFGHALVRMNRSTRYSNNKDPYKEDYWCRFSRKRGEESQPEFYFWFNGDHYGYGMGYYAADRLVMERFREMIAEEPQRVREAFSPVPDAGADTRLEICGDMYARDRSGGRFDGDPLLRDLYNRKNIHISSRADPCDEIFYSDKILGLLRGEFSRITGAYRIMLTLQTPK